MDKIEIEIDMLPPRVLRVLWNAVIKPKQSVPPTGCGFDKRQTFRNWVKPSGHRWSQRWKSMDQAIEAEKMHLLEQWISIFDTATLPVREEWTRTSPCLYDRDKKKDKMYD